MESIKEYNGIKLVELIQKNSARRRVHKQHIQECFELLNDPNGCKLDFVNTANRTPLMIACQYKESELCIKMLDFYTECGFDLKKNSVHDVYKVCCENRMESVCINFLELQFALVTKSNYYDILIMSTKIRSDYVLAKLLDDYNYIITLNDRDMTLLLKQQISDDITLKILKKATQFDVQNFKSTIYGSLLNRLCMRALVSSILYILDHLQNNFSDDVTYNNNTPLQIACKKKMENVCIKMLETPNKCALTNINKNGKTAFRISRENNMNNISAMIFNSLSDEEKKKISDEFISDPIYDLIGSFNKTYISANCSMDIDMKYNSESYMDSDLDMPEPNEKDYYSDYEDDNDRFKRKRRIY